MVNRLQKIREDAHLQLAAVATDSVGKSARAMLASRLAGQQDPAALAGLAQGRLPAKRPQLEQALTGRLRAQQGCLLADHVSRIAALDAALVRVSNELAERLRALEEEIARVDTIPGSSRRTAEVLLAEIGREMRRFPSAPQRASWAGRCPGNHASAGKRQRGKTRQGSRWLKQVLIEAAHGAARTQHPSLGAQYRR